MSLILPRYMSRTRDLRCPMDQIELLQLLVTAPLARSTPIVWNWCAVGNRRDLESACCERPDRHLTTCARAGYDYFNFAHSVLHRLPSGAFGRNLRGVRRALARTSKPRSASARPCHGVSSRVGERYDCVIERRPNECQPSRHILAIPSPYARSSAPSPAICHCRVSPFQAPAALRNTVLPGQLLKLLVKPHSAGDSPYALVPVACGHWCAFVVLAQAYPVDVEDRGSSQCPSSA